MTVVHVKPRPTTTHHPYSCIQKAAVGSAGLHDLSPAHLFVSGGPAPQEVLRRFCLGTAEIRRGDTGWNIFLSSGEGRFKVWVTWAQAQGPRGVLVSLSPRPQ
ncbi:hypothetical protein TNCV_2615951 [Trichonephila clavipes]|nr:hypothetical protein TNCV_2615951 [Trichonephila clavipes]